MRNGEYRWEVARNAFNASCFLPGCVCPSPLTPLLWRAQQMAPSPSRWDSYAWLHWPDGPREVHCHRGGRGRARCCHIPCGPLGGVIHHRLCLKVAILLMGRARDFLTLGVRVGRALGPPRHDSREDPSSAMPAACRCGTHALVPTDHSDGGRKSPRRPHSGWDSYAWLQPLDEAGGGSPPSSLGGSSLARILLGWNQH